MSERLVALARSNRAQLPLAALFGAAAALAFPPWHVWPLLVVGFSGLLWLLQNNLSGRRALLLGWSFGVGFFLVGVHWIGYAFLVDAERFGWMMPGAVVFMAAGLALFPAAAAGLTHFLGRPGWGRFFVLAASWGLAEWLRGTLFGGFPWHNLGFIWTGSQALLQSLSIFGVLCIGVLTVAAAAIPAMALAGPGQQRRQAGLAMLGCLAAIGALWLWGQHRLEEAPREYQPGLTLRLVQGAIPQADKWRRELRDAHLDKYLELSVKPSNAGVDVLIWPETATPFFLEHDRDRLGKVIASLTPGQVLITGTPRLAHDADGQRRLHNGVVALSSDGRRLAGYDKVHLVPFGEFLPFRSVLARIGLDKLAPGAVDYSPGTQAKLITLEGVPVFRPLICYEILFPGDVTAAGRPNWLLNLTNDAWFGPSAGPAQHLEISRARAVEQGLPLVRAANTGISAIIDAYGRTEARLELQQSGVIDGRLPANRPRTLFSRTGNWPFFALLAIFLILGMWPRIFRTQRSK
jgi:apolipoprotein N-acyltransferase